MLLREGQALGDKDRVAGLLPEEEGLSAADTDALLLRRELLDRLELPVGGAALLWLGEMLALPEGL